jgi:urea-proton symporter
LTYVFGFPGLWWFVSGATCQIVLYAVVAIELKRRAPRANTILEALRVRYGKTTHLIYFAYGVAVQIIITSALLLGGSAAFSVTTGVSTVAMNYLIPTGVVIYTYLGGLKATFISDYIHTVIIFVILLISMFAVMTPVSSVPILGSPGKLWEVVQAATPDHPAFGTKNGEYFTMESGQGVLLGAIIVVAGFGSVFVDPSVGDYHKTKFF